MFAKPLQPLTVLICEISEFWVSLANLWTPALKLELELRNISLKCLYSYASRNKICFLETRGRERFVADIIADKCG
jgi:hypothetical protein